jgi:hypothetical protein
MNTVTIGRFFAFTEIAAAVIFIMAATADPASANVLGQSCSMLLQIKRWLFTVVYILGACGLVIIAVTAFLGKFRFAHLISLGGGLFVVAMADLLIGFLAAGQTGNTCSTATTTTP